MKQNELIKRLIEKTYVKIVKHLNWKIIKFLIYLNKIESMIS
jgi:hypothetical protein